MLKNKRQLLDLLQALVWLVMFVALGLIRRERYGFLSIAAGLALLGIWVVHKYIVREPGLTVLGNLMASVFLIVFGLWLAMQQDFFVAFIVGLLSGMVIGLFEVLLQEKTGSSQR